MRIMAAVTVALLACVLSLASTAHAADSPSPDHTPAQANDEARRLAQSNNGQGDNSGEQTPVTTTVDSQQREDPPPSKSSSSLSIPPVVAWGLVVVVGLIFLYLIARSFVGRTKRVKVVDVQVDQAGDSPSSELRDELTPAERLRPGDAWRKRAADHELKSEWRLAVRARFRGLLVDLADSGVVVEARGKTAGEYRSDVGARQPDVAAPFDSAAALFEGAWFGPNEPTQAECDRIAHESTEVLAASK